MIDTFDKRDSETPREMLRYIAQPKGAPAGSHGKRGFLRLGFECDSQGRTILRDWERRAPLIVQQALYFDEELPDMACVYILSSGGPNVDGDRYEQIITLRQRSSVHLSTGAATKLAEMRYNYSTMRQTIRLEAGAYLEYLPEPIIPCRHSRYVSDTTIIIDPTATLIYAEIYFSGRRHFGNGERFQYDILSVATRAERPTGEMLFREKFIIQPHSHSPQTAGAMGGNDIYANVILLTSTEVADDIYSSTKAFHNPERGLSAGITRLASSCGLQYKVLGNDSGQVKALVREFASNVRHRVKQRPLRKDFPWR
jgi:urease accessory protein